MGQPLLADLAVAMQALSNAREVMITAARLLAEHLGADRCAYAEIEDETTFVVAGDYSRGVPSIVGRWPVVAFGAECERLMLANQPYVIDDIDSDPRAGAELLAYRQTNIQAAICVPLHKNGKLVAAMAVHQRVARVWTPAEIELVRMVVARSWETLERTRVEERCKSILESISDGFFALDRQWRFSFINRAGERFLDRTPGDLLGKNLWEEYPGTVGSKFEEVYRRVVKGQVAESFAAYYPNFDRWYEVSAYPSSDGLSAYFRDVTERHQTEERLRASEQTLAAIVERCPFGIYIVDHEFRIAHINKDSQDGAFRNVRPAVGRPFDEVMRVMWPEPVATDCINIFRHTLATGEPYYSRDFVKPRADVDQIEGYEWELHRLTLPSGRHGVVCYYYDSTPLRQAELELREAEGRFRKMADNSPVLIWETDMGGVTFVNRHYLDFFGQPAEAVQGLGWAKFLHPDDGAYLTAYQSAFARQEGYEYHARFRRHDGEYRWLHNVGTPHHGPAGAFIGFIGCSFDVTDIRRAAEDLKEADRKKDEFLATLAHELRNPLAPLRTGLDVMRMAGATGTVERARSMMDRQLTQLVRLVDDLLDVSRVSRGKLELRTERVDLRTVINAALETSRSVVEQAGHELTLHVPDEPIFVDGDMTRLAQVVSNLLNNAAKYTHRNGHVRLTAGHEGGMAVVSVKDDGIGIPPAMLGRVFEMFTQVDRTLEKTTGGLGIGLSLVKGVMESHGGTVEAKSDGEGKGSEFIVRLPFVKAVVVGPDRPNGQTSEVVPAALRRILVVDDNVDAADSLGELLQMLGNEVRTVNDGEAGIGVAGHFRPDVVLMDIGMPKLNGYEACRRIREQPWGQKTVIVALTGWGQDEDKRRSLEAGFDHHMVKPVDPAALKKLLAGLNMATV